MKTIKILELSRKQVLDSLSQAGYNVPEDATIDLDYISSFNDWQLKFQWTIDERNESNEHSNCG